MYLIKCERYFKVMHPIAILFGECGAYTRAHRGGGKKKMEAIRFLRIYVLDIDGMKCGKRFYNHFRFTINV